MGPPCHYAGMIRTLLLAVLLSCAAAPATAQSVSQADLQSRYDRALAAGYKALFLCGALANAERSGVNRTVESIEKWELTGLYPEIDDIVPSLAYRVVRAQYGMLSHVEVDWDEGMPPRFARASLEQGCRLGPIGMEPGPARTELVDKPGFAGSPDAAFWENRPRTADGAIALILPVPPLTFRDPRLEPVFDRAFDGTYGEGTRSTAVVIRQDGRDYPRYAEGFGSFTPQRTWSVAKSIAATLVGVAVHRGEVAVEDAGLRKEWAGDARSAITIDDLLRMSSGRYSDTPGNRTDPLYAGGSTVEETATGWPLVFEPGKVFRYANNDTLMAVKAVADRSEAFDPAAFFKAVGMRRTVAETDWAGDHILSSQVWTTAEDLARFGQLYLDDGVLPSGERILPAGWRAYVSAPSGPQPDGPLGYGAGFWLFDESEGIPADTFAAMGNRGQYVVIVPSRDIVIVRRGEDPAGARFDIVAFTRDVLANLTD